MMENLILYLKLGWEHIVSLEATDHQLFLLALVAPFVAKDFKKILILITAFTIGHCLTLALSSSGTVRISSYWIEWLIPFTIFLTAGFRVLHSTTGKKTATDFNSLYSMAGLFGLVHGLGFANTLKSLLGREQSILVPLAGFNIGIELGQMAVLAILLMARQVFQSFFPDGTKVWVLAISFFAGAGSIWMMWERI